MDRRSFLLSSGVIALFSATPYIRRFGSPAALILPDAYSLWYNRPAMVGLAGGFCFGYLTAAGDVAVAEITDDLLLRRTAVIARLDVPSDHGSPSLAMVPRGKYKGHVIACFSNHASRLMCARTTRPGDMGSWDSLPSVDDGRSTYASLATLPDGRVLLMHTLQERIGNYDSGEWRRTVVRSSDDGGDTWSDPVQLVGLGAGTFPYSTALALSEEGDCAMSYAIYRSATKRHQGLRVMTSSDAFASRCEIEIDLGADEHYDTIPYETKWISSSKVAVLFTQLGAGDDHGISKVAFVDVASRSVESIVVVSETAIHSYAGGATIADSGAFAVTSPPVGGLVRKDIRSGSVTTIVDQGSFSSPWIFSSGGKQLLAALRNPSIKNSRNFSSELFIAQL